MSGEGVMSLSARPQPYEQEPDLEQGQVGGPGGTIPTMPDPSLWSARGLADVIERHRGTGRHAFVDHTGAELPW